MRVAFLANRYLNPETSRSWSGLPFYIKRAFEQADIETVVFNLDEKVSLGSWAQFAYWKILHRKRYLRNSTAELLRSYGAQVEAQLASARVDAIFSPSSWPFAYLRTALPTFFWTDACFAGMVDFYGSFTQLAPPSLIDGHAAEQNALNRCTRALYSSEWAAETARSSYSVDPRKIAVVPFGGNLQDPPEFADVIAAIDRRDFKQCNLLLVGVDWKRKGVDIAISVAEALIARGFATRLTVVGCTPPKGFIVPSFVEVIPFISKQSPEGRRQLNEIYHRSHFFIMPSRAEAYGLVFAEANAFGLPCVATSIGGIPSIITNEVNGRLFEPEEKAAKYADYIWNVMKDPARYRKMAVSSADEAVTRLSWSVSGRKVADILGEITGKCAAASVPA